MNLLDLSHLAYRPAWAEQERIHAEVVAGGEGAIMLVEHPPVITMGRRGETLGVTNLRASREALESRGVEFVQTDRGGDITFHGPGQLVAYPIIKLIDFKLSVGGYVRLLQDVVIQTLGDFGVHGQTDNAGIGVWVPLPLPAGERAGVRGDRIESHRESVPVEHSTLAPHPNPLPRGGEGNMSKIAAVGVRVKQGVTLHGLALNVTADLSYFNLIVPCGIADKSVTSMQQILGGRCPAMAEVKHHLAANLIAAFDARRK